MLGIVSIGLSLFQLSWTEHIIGCVVSYILFSLLMRHFRGPSVIKVAQLWVYPIKSCGAVRVEESLVHRGGLQWDREFAIINASGEVLSQKTYPKLANICPVMHCTSRGSAETTSPGIDATLAGLTLRAGPSDANGVHVDLTKPGTAAVECTTTWGGNMTPLGAVRYPAADEWLAKYMGFACSLCRLTSRRALRTTRLAPVANDPLDSCRYQDGAPLTILAEESVGAVSRRFKKTVPACRFRPNIVVSGCTPLDEQSWSSVSIGGAADGDGGGEDGGGAAGRAACGIRVLMDAYRCTMVTIAQAAEEQPGVEAGSRPQGLDPRTAAEIDSIWPWGLDLRTDTQIIPS